VVLHEGQAQLFRETFAGQYFEFPGRRLLQRGERDPYVNVDFVMQHFSLEELPKFNGVRTTFPADRR
jgi:hypothetical protein